MYKLGDEKGRILEEELSKLPARPKATPVTQRTQIKPLAAMRAVRRPPSD